LDRGLERQTSPLDEEYRRLRDELAALRTTLAEKELDLVSLQTELHHLAQLYARTVGVKLADLDALEAEIAEAEARRDGTREARHRAEAARRRAEESAQQAQAEGGESDAEQMPPPPPTRSFRRLYLTCARKMHPDLAFDDGDRELRT
jgi:hypothetical protein